MPEPLREQLARLRYTFQAALNGWAQTWYELGESGREWWRHPMRGAN